jgi:hypothetical protein
MIGALPEQGSSSTRVSPIHKHAVPFRVEVLTIRATLALRPVQGRGGAEPAGVIRNLDDCFAVIPGPAEGRNPEAITPVLRMDSGFDTFAALWNDEGFR